MKRHKLKGHKIKYNSKIKEKISSVIETLGIIEIILFVFIFVIIITVAFNNFF